MWPLEQHGLRVPAEPDPVFILADPLEVVPSRRQIGTRPGVVLDPEPPARGKDAKRIARVLAGLMDGRKVGGLVAGQDP